MNEFIYPNATLIAGVDEVGRGPWWARWLQQR